MNVFGIAEIEELKKFLYSSHVHDAIFKDIVYSSSDKVLNINIHNPITKVSTYFDFIDVDFWFFMNRHDIGNPNTIISLTLEDPTSLPSNFSCEKDTIYMCFQMLSLDEIHVGSKRVFVKVVN